MSGRQIPVSYSDSPAKIFVDELSYILNDRIWDREELYHFADALGYTNGDQAYRYVEYGDLMNCIDP